MVFNSFQINFDFNKFIQIQHAEKGAPEIGTKKDEKYGAGRILNKCSLNMKFITCHKLLEAIIILYYVTIFAT